MSILPGRLKETHPNHPCDRCPHPFRLHALPEFGSYCRVVQAGLWRKKMPKPRTIPCFCDGYVRGSSA